MSNYPFKHLVVLMMENQSFDRLLGYVEGIGKLNGSEYVKNSNGEKVFAQKGAHPVKDHLFDPPHSTAATIKQLWGDGYTGQEPDGLGWLKSHWPVSNVIEEQNFMKCFDDIDEQLPAMVKLAKNYVVCDRNFSSMPGPTAPNRLFLHAATSGGYTGGTWLGGEDKLNVPKSMQSIFEAIDDTDANLGWNLYNIEPDMTTALAFPYVRSKPKNIRTFEQFEEDCKNDHLPAYSVINPDLYVNSQHAGGDGASLVDGDNYIASVYEAIRRNQEVFDKTLFYITYDEAGGYWDSVVSKDILPQTENSFSREDWPDKGPEYDFRYAGTRIPGLLISPWLDHSIDSTFFEHSSVAATVKELFKTEARGPGGFLTPRDQAANNLVSGLKLRTTPRRDLPYLPRSKYNHEMLEARAMAKQKKVIK
jgi:phospholipase C